MATIEQSNSDNFIGWQKVNGNLSIADLQADGLPPTIDRTQPLPFVSVWKTDNTGSSNNDQITLPTDSSGTYNFEVDWGDGSTDWITSYNQAETVHTYATEGTYRVSCAGVFIGIKVNDDPQKLLKITDWGDLVLGLTSGFHFQACLNLVITASDDLVLGTDNLDFSFQQCTSLTSFPLIDTSGVTSMLRTWKDCTNISSFPLIDTSNVTEMDKTWQSCHSITSFPLIDTSNVTDLIQTWSDCIGLTSFPLIDTSSVTNMKNTWEYCEFLQFPLINTINVTNMDQTWSECVGLTSFPLIDTSSVTYMKSAWFNCNSMASFPLIDTSASLNMQFTWYGCTSFTSFPTINLTVMTSGNSMLEGTNIGTPSWDDLLVATRVLNVNTGVTWHGGSAQHTSQPASGGEAYAALTTRVPPWTITDGGATPGD